MKLVSVVAAVALAVGVFFGGVAVGRHGKQLAVAVGTPALQTSSPNATDRLKAKPHLPTQGGVSRTFFADAVGANSSIDYLWGNAGCDNERDIMSFLGLVTVAQDRFPGGTWVAWRYAYTSVDPSSLQAIG